MKVTINLLPPERKEELKQKRNIGVILKISVMAFSALLVFIVFIIFCLMTLNIRVQSLKDQQNRLMENKKYGQIKKSQEFAENYYKQTSGIERILKQQNYNWDLFSEVNKLVSENIYLKEIALQEGALSISGFSSTREALLKFKEDLENSSRFSKIEAPISNFTSSQDINFNFKAEIK